jgi:hypothetical protein
MPTSGKVFSTIVFSKALFLASILSTLCQGAEAVHIKEGAVSFFSPEGRKIAQELAIPPPPVRILPIEKVDPPRNVLAKEWNAPFCVRWDDGCTECERENVDDRPRCNEIAYLEISVCAPRSVECTKEKDIERVCSTEGTRYDLLLDGKYFRDRGSFSAQMFWVFWWEKGTGKGSWQIQLAEDGYMPRVREPFIDPTRLLEVKEIMCDKPQRDAVINPKP